MWTFGNRICLYVLRQFVTGSCDFEVDNFRVFGFIDNTIFSTCRPGGGPRRDGHRNDPNLKRAFYNGWKKNRGCKIQKVDLPNGINLPGSP